MSNLLEQASLVMIPSGYAEDIVYSEIPLDGSGDMVFSRASDGTRVNSAGLVEVCPWNIVQNSEDLSAGWILAAATIGANATTAPNGTSTADSFTSSATLANHVAYQLVTGVSGAYTFSAYVKKANSQYVYLKLVGNASDWVAAVFDLNDGTLTKSEATGWTGLTASSESVGNGWYRLIVSGSGATSVNFNVGIQYTNTGTPTFSAYADASFTGTGTIDYYIWGAQLNIGSTAKPYFPTTDRLNVPRLTYQNGGGGCPSLLLEKQSTNLYLYSEQLNLWSTVGSPTITGNDSTSPDGTTNADRVQFNASGNLVYNSGTGSAGTNVLTVYAKAKSGTAQKFRFFANGATTISSDFTATDQWQRFEFIYTFSAVTAGLQGASTGASDVLFWGFQHEVSSYATSYIPTTSASATRVADACFKTGITSLIGQTEGVMFLDFELKAYDSLAKWIAFLGGGSYYIGLYTDGNSRFVAEVYDGAIQFVNQTFTFSVGQRYKIAIAYKANDFAFYINGTQIATDSSGTVPTTSAFSFEYNSTAAQLTTRIYNQSALFKTRLTNAELASLTTL
jgi:hypothetical protein